MSVERNQIDPKSYLSKFYCHAQNLGNTGTADWNMISNSFQSTFLVPVACHLNRAMFNVAADQTASNGVTVTLKNESRSANIFTLADGNRLQSQVSTVDTTAVDWSAGVCLVRSATNTAMISAMSLLSVTFSATVGTAAFAAAFEFDVKASYARDLSRKGQATT